jgi:hypothetical protein
MDITLPEPTMTFKGDEAKDFLKERNGGWELLQQYLEDLTVMPKDLSSIQVSLLKNPYKEMAWIFARVAGQESTATIPRLALYILHFTIHEKTIFDWEKLFLENYLFSYQISRRIRNSTCPHI